MTANHYRSAAEQVLAALDLEAPLIEHYDPVEIETLPIAEVKQRLAELQLRPSPPLELRTAIRASTPSRPAELLGPLAVEINEQLELRRIEERPLVEVVERLNDLGVNYQVGTKKIMDLVLSHAERPLSRTSRKPVALSDQLRHWWREPGFRAAAAVMAIAAAGTTAFMLAARTSSNSAAIRAGREPVALTATTPSQDSEQRQTASAEDESQAENTALISVHAPKKVRTISIRPDGLNLTFETLVKPKRNPGRSVVLASTAVAEPPAAQERVQARADDDQGPLFQWPVHGRLIAGFGAKLLAPNSESAPGTSTDQRNSGIDIAVAEGTPIKAADDGHVAYAGHELKGYGNLILIRHANGFVTAYANASKLLVRPGDVVKRGQVIARSGQTGNVTGPQLHFEVRKGATPVDPTQYLSEKP